MRRLFRFKNYSIENYAIKEIPGSHVNNEHDSFQGNIYQKELITCSLHTSSRVLLENKPSMFFSSCNSALWLRVRSTIPETNMQFYTILCKAYRWYNYGCFESIWKDDGSIWEFFQHLAKKLATFWAILPTPCGLLATLRQKLKLFSVCITSILRGCEDLRCV